ncbi:N-terminal phage integrase SAM-like domain-containing protein [Occultella kanbiaonis]|uniref:N-terminal phage integrase SAM-like domain-containing protein n=1 Tax=Occultella kanbiaonis TaxID=2675754 RepID=UPI0013D36BA2|nr:N-terminal phage integrase SAM-like domain-containing protein [Occultella kanbiaonis]
MQALGGSNPPSSASSSQDPARNSSFRRDSAVSGLCLGAQGSAPHGSQRHTHAFGVFDTLRDARAALDIAKGERARGTFVPPTQIQAERRAAQVRAETDALTLAEWAEQWLEDLAANPERSPSTVLSYRSVLRTHVLPELGATRLVDLRPGTSPPPRGAAGQSVEAASGRASQWRRAQRGKGCCARA